MASGVENLLRVLLGRGQQTQEKHPALVQPQESRHPAEIDYDEPYPGFLCEVQTPHARLLGIVINNSATPGDARLIIPLVESPKDSRTDLDRLGNSKKARVHKELALRNAKIILELTDPRETLNQLTPGNGNGNSGVAVLKEVSFNTVTLVFKSGFFTRNHEEKNGPGLDLKGYVDSALGFAEVLKQTFGRKITLCPASQLNAD